MQVIEMVQFNLQVFFFNRLKGTGKIGDRRLHFSSKDILNTLMGHHNHCSSLLGFNIPFRYRPGPSPYINTTTPTPKLPDLFHLETQHLEPTSDSRIRYLINTPYA